MTDLVSLAVRDFSAALASDAPAPGGGSASAAAGAMGAALLGMVCRLTLGKEKYRDAWEELERIASAMDRDRDTLLGCSRCGRSACPDCLRDAPVGQHCLACVEGLPADRIALRAEGTVNLPARTYGFATSDEVAAARAQLSVSPETYPLSGPATLKSTPEWFNSPYESTTNLDAALAVQETGDVAHRNPLLAADDTTDSSGQ